MEKRISHKDTHSRFLDFQSLWRSRELLAYFVKRDLMVSYKQTILGLLWVLVQPLAMALMILFVFGRIGNFPDYGLPYMLIALSALSIWEFFANSVGRSSICLIDDRDIIIRVNFPRILLLFNSALRNSLGFAINLIVIFGVMFYYGVPITAKVLIIPFIYVMTVLLNLGLGLWVGTCNVFFRDVSTLVPYLLRLGLFVSPVAFTLHSVPEQWQMLYSLNPLVGIIEGMRFCLLGDQFQPSIKILAVSFFSLFTILFSGLYIFGRFERQFADVI